MSIFKRFKDIMEANANAKLDKMENPENMIDQYVRNMEKELAQVKAETAEVMAREAQTNRALVNLEKNIMSYEERAIDLLKKGAEDEAKALISRKIALETSMESYKLKAQEAKEDSEKMRQVHDNLESKLNMLMEKGNELKATNARAATQETINRVNGKTGFSIMNELDKLEEKINFRLDKANSIAVLNNSHSAEKLNDKYNEELDKRNKAVSAEMERLRGFVNCSEIK